MVRRQAAHEQALSGPTDLWAGGSPERPAVRTARLGSVERAEHPDRRDLEKTAVAAGLGFSSLSGDFERGILAHRIDGVARPATWGTVPHKAHTNPSPQGASDTNRRPRDEGYRRAPDAGG